MKFKIFYTDAGRSKYFKSNNRVGDCVVRAICLALELDYKNTYNHLNNFLKSRGSYSKRNNSRTSILQDDLMAYMDLLGWEYKPLKKIKGRYHHLNPVDLAQLPPVYIALLRKHIVAVKFGYVMDRYDCTKNGRRAVYGVFVKK